MKNFLLIVLIILLGIFGGIKFGNATDLTFGYTEVGTAEMWSLTTNYLDGSIFTSPTNSENALVKKITFYYVGTGISVNIKAVLVKNNDLSVIAVGNPVAIDTDGWYDSVFPMPPQIHASTEYLLMLITDSIENPSIAKEVGDTNQFLSSSDNNYSDPISPTGEITKTNEKLSIYATYVPEENSPVYHLIIPVSILNETLNNINATFGDAGFMLLLGIFMGLPLFFWIVRKIIKMIPKGKGGKKWLIP